MSRYFFLTLFFSVLFVEVFSQELPWETWKVPSNALKNKQVIQVYLPDGYDTSDKSYPVLYVIDGHWYFFNGVSIQKTLRGDLVLPKMIVVGIDFKHRQYRDSLFNASWEEVVTFCGTELPPFIEQHYRTKGENIIFGWEQAAFMVSELLFREQPYFDGYILSNGGYVNDEMINNYENAKDKKRYAYLANSTKDIYTIDHSEAMATQLAANSFDHLDWKYELMDSEEHETLTYHSMYFGLRHFYHNYPSLVYSSTAEFEEKGGMVFLKKYFQERGARFGFDPEIDRSTKNSLIWLAWKRDDFPAFKRFMDIFQDVLSTPRYASAYWQNRLGQFYLKYGDHQPAIEHFNKGIAAYPDDRYMAKMYAGLGKAHQAQNEKKLAKANFRKAISFARAHADPNLQQYEELLEGLK